MILIALDRSGSVPPDRLREYVAAAGTAKVLAPSEVKVVLFNTHVTEDLSSAPSGGTSFDAIRDYAQQFPEYPELIVVLTDGEAQEFVVPIEEQDRWVWLFDKSMIVDLGYASPKFGRSFDVSTLKSIKWNAVFASLKKGKNMTDLQYTIVGGEDGSWVTVFVAGRKPEVAHSTHPNFDAIKAGVEAGDESVVDLFDVAQSAASKFETLTERVTTSNGKLYLDGVEVHNSLAAQVVEFLRQGVEDWKPLVNFFEKVQNNPSEHSREQLYTWLEKQNFTITDSGDLVGYKGVRKVGDSFESINHGKAIVDGVVHNGAIPNHIGAVVTMPRDEVEFNPAVGCHTGLHVGTYEYANSFARGALLEVHVNPRDVVSVPTDCGAAKMRVCRYVSVGVIDKPYSEPVVRDYFDQGDFWGDGEDDGNCEDCETGDCDCTFVPDEVLDVFMTQAAKVTLPTALVSVNDQFDDLDRRRNRTLVITAVNGGEAEYVVADKGNTGTIKVSRLLTPYRFRKV